jgi:Insertion element 4 transposase N-terminal/Transposase DDE domain
MFWAGAPLLDQSVITRRIAVAAGVFAPGHLGELTQVVPFEMVDEALAETGTVQSRIRDLPSRVVVYLLLAGALFADCGYGQVWHRLVAGLRGIVVAAPTDGGLCQARQRVGVKPMRFLFDLLRGAAVTSATGSVRWCGLLVCAIDGTVMSVPDHPANLDRFIKHRSNNGGSGYPLIRVMVLVCCGTRTLIDAVFGPTCTGEVTYAYELIRGMRAGMIVLLDRNFGAAQLLAAIHAVDAHILVRLKDNRKMPVIGRHRDGSYLSVIGKTRVRVITAEIVVATRAGRATSVYRLATTLLDDRRYPAFDLVKLYHARWEIETAYLEIKSTILGGRVLRARTPTGIEQEIYALLVAYQILRTAMLDATDSRGEVTPDRASFTVALHTARDQIVLAAGVIAGTAINLVGAIGEQVLANLLPERRLRLSTRAVKRAISKYNGRGPNIDRASYKATISIDILAPPSLTTHADP